MKYLITTLLLLTGFSFAHAQQTDTPSPTIEAVSIMPVMVDGFEGTTTGERDSKRVPYGDDGKILPIPTLYQGTDTGETKSDGTELDDIGAPSVEREMKESGEKGGTADINIGVGELNETDTSHKDWIVIESMSSPRKKSELIDEISDDSGGVERSGGFIKIGDIKGESTDDREAKKPKEIVVVGSKVRGEDVPQLIGAPGEGEESKTTPDSFFDIWVGDTEARVDSFFDIHTEVTDEDLQLQAISVAQSNEDVEEVLVSGEGVEVKFRAEAKLFGIIPLGFTKRVSVETTPEGEGVVKVKFPWWYRLAVGAGSPADVEEELQSALANDIPQTTDADDRPTEEVAFYYNKIQAQALQTISNISK